MLLFLASFTRIGGPIKDSQNNSRADPSLMVDRGRARVINWSGQETEKARHLLIMTRMAQMMAMRKTLDERARKKALDAIFNRFDFNQNGAVLFKSLVLGRLSRQGFLS